MTEQKISTDIKSAPKNINRNLFLHALDIMSNQGILIKGNGSGIQDKFVSGIVKHTTDEIDQLVWVEKIHNGTCFSINAFQGHENVSQRLYLINREKCFDSEGKPVNGDQLREASQLLGFIGKNLSQDLNNP